MSYPPEQLGDVLSHFLPFMVVFIQTLLNMVSRAIRVKPEVFVGNKVPDRGQM